MLQVVHAAPPVLRVSQGRGSIMGIVDGPRMNLLDGMHAVPTFLPTCSSSSQQQQQQQRAESPPRHSSVIIISSRSSRGEIKHVVLTYGLVGPTLAFEDTWVSAYFKTHTASTLIEDST